MSEKNIGALWQQSTASLKLQSSIDHNNGTVTNNELWRMWCDWIITTMVCRDKAPYACQPLFSLLAGYVLPFSLGPSVSKLTQMDVHAAEVTCHIFVTVELVSGNYFARYLFMRQLSKTSLLVVICLCGPWHTPTFYLATPHYPSSGFETWWQTANRVLVFASCIYKLQEIINWFSLVCWIDVCCHYRKQVIKL